MALDRNRLLAMFDEADGWLTLDDIALINNQNGTRVPSNLQQMLDDLVLERKLLRQRVGRDVANESFEYRSTGAGRVPKAEWVFRYMNLNPDYIFSLDELTALLGIGDLRDILKDLFFRGRISRGDDEYFVAPCARFVFVICQMDHWLNEEQIASAAQKRLLDERDRHCLKKAVQNNELTHRVEAGQAEYQCVQHQS